MNLASPRAAKKAADTPAMAEARLRFLQCGFYDPFVARLAQLMADAPSGPVVDVGCGPGFYLQRAPDAREAVGVDLSKAALKRAARALPAATFAVADVEEAIPVADRCAAVVLSVFAPRPVGELARILRPDGRLLVAAAAPGHLRELRDRLGLLSVPEDKERSLRERFEVAFAIDVLDRVSFGIELAPEEARDLVAMGPNAWHQEATIAPTETVATAVDILLLGARQASRPLQGSGAQ